MRGCAVVLLAIPALSVACSESNAVAPAAPDDAASVPQFARTAPAAPSEAPSASAEAATPAATSEPAAEPSASAVAEAEPLPDVEIKTIGMHIGGGPNDKETKAPIRKAVEAKLDAFRACFALVTKAEKGGTFGVDVRIPGEGGQAKISDPRSGLEGDGVEKCMLAAFENVDFARPPKGVPMVVSYSLRFTPR